MTSEIIDRFVEETLRDLFDTMVPESINGHHIESHFDVDPEPGCINIHLNMIFAPAVPMYDGKHDFYYREMIPRQYLMDPSGKQLFARRKRDIVKDMICDVAAAIIEMDKKYPQCRTEHLGMWDKLKGE